MRKKMEVVLLALELFLMEKLKAIIPREQADRILDSWEKGRCPLLDVVNGSVKVLHPGGGLGKDAFVSFPHPHPINSGGAISELNALLLKTGNEAGLNWRRVAAVWNMPKDRLIDRYLPAHECVQLRDYQRSVPRPEQLPLIENYSDGPTLRVPWLGVPDGHIAYKIGYCPFCGVKLTMEAEKE